MLQAFHRQLHNPWNQQGKTVGGKEKTPPGGIAQAEREDIVLQECKLFNGVFPSLGCVPATGLQELQSSPNWQVQSVAYLCC